MKPAAQPKILKAFLRLVFDFHLGLSKSKFWQVLGISFRFQQKECYDQVPDIMGTVKAAQAVAKDARSAFSLAAQAKAAAKKAAGPKLPKAAKSKAAPKAPQEVAPNGGAWTQLLNLYQTPCLWSVLQNL